MRCVVFARQLCAPASPLADGRFFKKLSALRCHPAFFDLLANLRAMRVQPDLLLMQQQDSLLHEVVDAAVGAVFEVLPNQRFQFRTKVDVHAISVSPTFCYCTFSVRLTLRVSPVLVAVTVTL